MEPTGMDTSFTINGLGTFHVDTDRGYIWMPGRKAASFTHRQTYRIFRAAEKAFPDAIAGEWCLCDDLGD